MTDSDSLRKDYISLYWEESLDIKPRIECSLNVVNRFGCFSYLEKLSFLKTVSSKEIFIDEINKGLYIEFPKPAYAWFFVVGADIVFFFLAAVKF